MHTFRSIAFAVVALPALVCCTGCFATVGDYVGSGDHETLRQVLNLPADTLLDEAMVKQALDEKFPPGTSRDEVVASLPPTEPDVGVLVPWSPWVVTSVPDSLADTISIWSGTPPNILYGLTCGFGIGIDFAGGTVSSTLVNGSCTGF